jgi:hypothetical protein
VFNPGGSNAAVAGARNRISSRPNKIDMPNLDPEVKRRNWIVLVVLVAVALAIYVAFMMKL